MTSIQDVLSKYDFQPLWPEQQIQPSEALVRELEQTIGTYLPVDYRSFLLQHGSLSPSGDPYDDLVVWVPGRQRYRRLFGFMGFFRHEDKHPGVFNLDLIHAYGEWQSQLGATFLPIVEGEQGSLFALKLSGEQKGSLWAWIPDPVQGDTWDEMVQVYGLYRVSPDITTFVLSIKDRSEVGDEET